MTDSDRRPALLDPAGAKAVGARLGDGLASPLVDGDPLARFDVPVESGDVPADVLDLLDQHVDDPEAGFFELGAIIREVLRGRQLYLGVASGILLQIAHPKVGAGVGDHGSLETEPIERLRRTFDAFDAIVFGDAASAVRAAVTVRTLHERVTGRLDADAGTHEAGEHYHANDPELLLWVGATLVVLPIRNYETYVRALSEAEKQTFYEQMKLLNRLFGVPERCFPESYTDLQAYFESIVETELGTTDSGQAAVDGFLDNAPASPLVRFLASSQLPPAARDALGLSWGGNRQRLFEAFAAAVRSIPLGAVPDRLRYRANYRQYGRHGSG